MEKYNELFYQIITRINSDLNIDERVTFIHTIDDNYDPSSIGLIIPRFKTFEILKIYFDKYIYSINGLRLKIRYEIYHTSTEFDSEDVFKDFIKYLINGELNKIIKEIKEKNNIKNKYIKQNKFDLFSFNLPFRPDNNLFTFDNTSNQI